MKRLIIIAVAIAGNAAHATEPITLYQSSQCANGKCGPVVQAGQAVVQYAGSVSQAVVKPLQNKPIRTFAKNVRAKLTGKCR